jgi:hypothetical protein
MQLWGQLVSAIDEGAAPAAVGGELAPATQSGHPHWQQKRTITNTVVLLPTSPVRLDN